MNITIICEGQIETAFKPHLVAFLKTRLSGSMPKLKFDRHDGPIPKQDKLRRVVSTLLNSRKEPSDAVIALTDVYPDFTDAEQAKTRLCEWVGNETHFHAHAALHDFEAWLLPYWDRIKELAGSDSKSFGANPETVNHVNPPAHRLSRLFEAGTCRNSYSKPRDANRILKDADLMVSMNACPELKAFINTILRQCGAQLIAQIENEDRGYRKHKRSKCPVGRFSTLACNLNIFSPV